MKKVKNKIMILLDIKKNGVERLSCFYFWIFTLLIYLYKNQFHLKQIHKWWEREPSELTFSHLIDYPCELHPTFLLETHHSVCFLSLSTNYSFQSQMLSLWELTDIRGSGCRGEQIRASAVEITWSDSQTQHLRPSTYAWWHHLLPPNWALQ